MDANELMTGFESYVEEGAELHEVVATSDAPATSWPCIITLSGDC